MSIKNKIFLTGASGNMGKATLENLLERNDRFDVIALVLPTEKDKKSMSQLAASPGLEIVWGDLTNYDDVLKCMNGVDYILHLGAIIPPLADHNRELATKVNIGGTRNIIKAIQVQPNKDNIKLIYIGSAGQTGDRNIPIHWGRTGDPIKINTFDNYSLTKTLAEKEVIESGLKYWVSLRHTGLLHNNVDSSAMDPLVFRQPFNGVFEWSTIQMSGLMLANACESSVPEEFWRRVYNVGGGEKYRTTNLEFMEKSMQITGMGNFTKMVDLNWFVTGNSQGQWYVDSDILENYLHFRSSSIEEFLESMKEVVPSALLKIMKFIPPFVVKKFMFEPMAKKEGGTMYWIKNNEEDKINAYFGSKEKWEQIPTWKDYKKAEPSKIPTKLNHGYDETKPKSELDLEDMKMLAEFRGGTCWSASMNKGDLHTKLKWECAFGHEFEATPALVLLAGHWCTECICKSENYASEAEKNPFFAQVWNPLHGKR
jgi:nucleoside-diphosphate-sugar epimerase